ncbi:MAG: hypothetical protein QOK36_2344, partial [Gaiellales bacterium]|nr:hypothetical protein [Gaiellales bacterium]
MRNRVLTLSAALVFSMVQLACSGGSSTDTSANPTDPSANGDTSAPPQDLASATANAGATPGAGSATPSPSIPGVTEVPYNGNGSSSSGGSTSGGTTSGGTTSGGTTSGGTTSGGTTSGGTSAAPSEAPPAQGGRDTHDPLRPQGHATLDPSTRQDTEAAVQGNWPLLVNDEFDGTELNRAHWSPYTGETTGGIGEHDPRNLAVSDGTLKLTSHGYSSAGMAWLPGQQYGRWEVRARAQQGTGYGAVILLWPDAEDWPQGGEINFMEIPNPQRNESHFVLHYGKDNSQ